MTSLDFWKKYFLGKILGKKWAKKLLLHFFRQSYFLPIFENMHVLRYFGGRAKMGQNCPYENICLQICYYRKKILYPIIGKVYIFWSRHMGLYREKYIFQIFSCPGPQKIHNGGNYCGIFFFFFQKWGQKSTMGLHNKYHKSIYIYIFFWIPGLPEGSYKFTSLRHLVS